jgi:hypothetical protein
MSNTSKFGEALTASRPAFLAMFGVDITFQPGVLDRAITAIVRYVTDAGKVEPVARLKSPRIHIKVANDSTLGIAANEFLANQTGLKVNLPPRKGATARDFHLAKIIAQNAASVTYEVN